METRSMKQPVLRRWLQVSNRAGLHMRPSAVIVSTVSHFMADCTFHSVSGSESASSILGLSQLNVSGGQWVLVETEGLDAHEAMEALTQLFETEFAFEPDDAQTVDQGKV